MIVIEDLHVELPGFKLYIPRLEIEENEYLIVMGPSGVGKTVFLHTLTGFIKPVKGKILVDGRNIVNDPPEKRGIALIPQDYGLFPHLTVYDNIAFPLEIRGYSRESVEKQVYSIAEKLGIKYLLKRMPRSLSGGEKQRVALARALVMKPYIVLLDEPLSNLDPGIRGSVRKFLKKIHRETGFTAIHVTHNIIEAIDLGEHIAFIENGILRGKYSVKEFLETKYAEPYIDELRIIKDLII